MLPISIHDCIFGKDAFSRSALSKLFATLVNSGARRVIFSSGEKLIVLVQHDLYQQQLKDEQRKTLIIWRRVRRNMEAPAVEDWHIKHTELLHQGYCTRRLEESCLAVQIFGLMVHEIMREVYHAYTECTGSQQRSRLP